MEKKPALPRRVWGWINGSIRRRLTLLVLLICLVLIALVFLLVVRLVEPTYENSLQSDLERALNTIVSEIDEHTEEGGSVTTILSLNGVLYETLSDECLARINEAVTKSDLSVGERSIDIANSNNDCIGLMDYLSDSVLHPLAQGPLSPGAEQKDIGASGREENGPVVTGLRADTQAHGETYQTIVNGQMVVGATTADGEYTVLVAANMERIEQAVNVFKQLMVPISLVLIFISVAAAWLFSRWFTRPLTSLSIASRELARGNYNVQVNTKGNDEISKLAGDFNVMAREVQRSSELQRDLLANVSHDLRTPLTLIKGYAETVRDLTGDNETKRNQQMDVIVDESDRLSTLVGRVMELSRVSSGNEKPEPVLFDLAQLCDEIAYRYNEFCALNGYNFQFTSAEPCEVYADPALIERALTNLLGNAINHVGEDGFIGFSIRRGESGRARVEVADHGPGIAPADLPYIFDRYYRSRKDAGKAGTGLGLSITKAIFLAQNIDYGVESTPGAGATFWFEVPLAGTGG